MKNRSGQLESGMTVIHCGPEWPSGNHMPMRRVTNPEWEEVWVTTESLWGPWAEDSYVTTCLISTLEVFSDTVGSVCETTNHHNWDSSKKFNTLWTGDADLRFYITTVQDKW